MQRITRARLVLSLALVGALALAGCGGGDDAYSISAEDQARIDTLTDDVAAANKKAADDLAAAKTQAEADLKTAQDEIDSLTAQIGMAATDDMAATGLHKQLAGARAAAATAQMTIGELTATIGMMPGDDGMGGSGLQGDLAMYKATAADLAMQIGMMDDPTTEADESSGLQGQLAMYQAKAADLQDTLGMMTDGDMAATGLYKELADAQSMVAKLQTQIGDMPGEDGMGGSGLEADLAKYKVMVGDLEMKIGMMDDPTTTEADESSGLYKQLADAMAEAQMYKDMVGMEADGDNPEATGLYKMIADAEAKATMYKAQLDTLQGTIDSGDMADVNAQAKALLAVLMENNVAVTIPDGGTETEYGTNEHQNKSGLSGTMIDTALTADAEEVADERQRVANDVSNLMVEVSNDGMLMAEVRDNAAYSMADMAPDMIEDWRGAMLTREQADGTMDTVVVYSNIGDDGMASLLDRYVSMRPTTTKPRTWTITVLGDADSTPATPNVPLDTTLIPWSEVERPDTKTSFAGTGTDVMLTFKGTVHDIPGTFSCPSPTSTTCRAPARYSGGKVNTLVYHSSDNVDGAESVWTFVPDEGVSLYTDDTTYLTFGWWLDKNAAGNPTDFLAFHMASKEMGPARNAGTNAIVAGTDGGTRGTPAAAGTSGTYLRGTATYEGAAAGKYATASTISAAYEGGHFTADATLMVDFDADMDGDSDTTSHLQNSASLASERLS